MHRTEVSTIASGKVTPGAERSYWLGLYDPGDRREEGGAEPRQVAHRQPASGRGLTRGRKSGVGSVLALWREALRTDRGEAGVFIGKRLDRRPGADVASEVSQTRWS